jgi:glycosyltransferase involved in cell wall biosynthesis
VDGDFATDLLVNQSDERSVSRALPVANAIPRVLCLPTGPDEYSVAVARALAGETALHFAAPGPLIERYRDDLLASVGVYPLRWPRHRDPHNLGLIMQLVRLVQSVRPDVIHFLGDSVVWLALALPLLRRLPLVVTVHDVRYHPGDVQSRTVPMATVQRLRRAADALIVHGQGLRDELLATGVRPVAGVHSIPHPVLDRHRRLAQRAGLARAPNDGAQRILFFGRMMAYKGLGLLVEASDRVVAVCPNARFIVAGSGPDLDRWRRPLAARPWFEIRERQVPDLEVAQLFLDADLVVMPYIEASQSGVMALAAGFGRPVVATAVGELGTLVEATNMGPVVPPQAAALSAAIVHLLLSPEQRAQHAACAVAAAQGLLAPRQIASATSCVYQHALAALGRAGEKRPGGWSLRAIG